jgi:di/tricarboxylate transporter
MSAAFYGALNAQREATEEEKSKTDKSPGFGTYIDVVAALVPAEILAANALLISLMVSTTEKDGKSVTEVTDPGSMKLMFVLSILLSVVLYVLGDRTRARVAARKRKEAGEGEAKMVPWSGWNYVRALIPAGAYVAWTMLQKSTAFDAIAPDMSEAKRAVIAVFGAIVLAAIAKGLSDKADGSEPPAGGKPDAPGDPDPEAAPPPTAEAILP